MGRGGGSAQRHAELLANRCSNGIYVTIHISSQSRDFPAGLGRLRAGRMGVTSSSAGTRKRYGLPTTASDLRASSSRSRSGLGRSWTGPGPRRRPVILLGGFVGDGMAAWSRQVEAFRIPTPSWSGTPQDQVSHPTCRSLSTARLRGLPCRLGVRLEAGAAQSS
jgi:hypothetical protein